MKERIETGALQIDDDWTGLFVRGDDTFTLRYILYKAYRSEKLTTDEKFFCVDRVVDIDFNVNHSSEDRDVQRIKTRAEKDEVDDEQQKIDFQRRTTVKGRWEMLNEAYDKNFRKFR